MADDKKLDDNIERINLREKVLDAVEKEEMPTTPDQARENVPSPEGESVEKEQAPAVVEEKPAEPTAVPSPTSGQQYHAKQKRIESVLARDLEGLYMEMPDEKRAEFKKQGEETAAKINELMSKGKATAKKVIDLIKKWLSLIPGVNKYFLEQEAKIKTDEIFKIGR